MCVNAEPRAQFARRERSAFLWCASEQSRPQGGRGSSWIHPRRCGTLADPARRGSAPGFAIARASLLAGAGRGGMQSRSRVPGDIKPRGRPARCGTSRRTWTTHWPLLRGRPASTTSGYDSVPSDSHQKRLQSGVRALGSSHIDFGTKVKWHRRCCSGFRGRRSSLDSRRRVRSDTGGDCHCVERTG